MSKIPDTINQEELKKILAITNKPFLKLAFILGFYQGMRISEVMRLELSDFDKQSLLIHIRQSKGAKDRMIPIMPEVIKPLKHLPIGTHYKNLKSGIRSLEITFKRLGKVALGKNLHFHCLRHSCATWLLNDLHWSTREVQQFLGHSKVQTTEIYTHVRPDNLTNRVWGNESMVEQAKKDFF